MDKNTFYQLSNGDTLAVNNVRNGSIIALNEVANRMTFTYVAHVIHEDKIESNKNGLNWQEKYVQDNIDSAVNMPIKYSRGFDNITDDHGYFEVDLDGELISYYSEIAGSVTSAKIDTIPNTDKRGLICEAYIDTIVHSELAEWMKLRFLEGKTIDTSIEIAGKRDENKKMGAIVYEDNDGSPKIPVAFDYIGSAILGIEPADNYSTILVVNSKGEEVNMNLEELKNDNARLTNELKTSGETVEERDASIVELNANIEKLNGSVETMTADNTVLQAYKDENEETISINSAISKLEAEFSEEILKEFDGEIEKFKTNSKEFNMAELRINMYKKSMDVSNQEAKDAKDELVKLNSANNNEEDIFVVNEDNENQGSNDDLDIFE